MRYTSVSRIFHNFPFISMITIIVLYYWQILQPSRGGGRRETDRERQRERERETERERQRDRQRERAEERRVGKECRL